MSKSVCHILGCPRVSLGCPRQPVGTSFFKLPNPRKGIDIFRQWLQLTGNQKFLNMDVYEAHKKIKVCARHFKTEDFVTNRKLKDGVIPSLHLPLSLGTSLIYSINLEESDKEKQTTITRKRKYLLDIPSLLVKRFTLAPEIDELTKEEQHIEDDATISSTSTIEDSMLMLPASLQGRVYQILMLQHDQPQ